MTSKARLFAEALDSTKLEILSRNQFMEKEIAVYGQDENRFFQLFDDGSFLCIKGNTFLVFSPKSIFDFLVNNNKELIEASQIVEVIHTSNSDRGHDA